MTTATATTATIAHQAATRDRTGTADLLLDQAVREAVQLIRTGETGRATYELARAAGRADRVLGTGR